MVSNALSPRRAYLRRPKVCKPPPPPPPPSELPPRYCYFNPDEDTITTEEQFDPEFVACCASLPEAEHVDVELGCDDGEWDPMAGFGNCIDDQTNSWHPPGSPGLYQVWCKFTWSDTGTCTAYAAVTVEEEENGDDE